MKVYIAGPLFNEMERQRNKDISELVESFGFETYLPQRDGGIFAELLASGKNIIDVRKEIFKKDIESIKNCDVILCLLDGRVPDEGMCVELGVAYTLNKKCIGYRTDSRVQEAEGMNIILEGVLEKVLTTREDLSQYLKNYGK